MMKLTLKTNLLLIFTLASYFSFGQVVINEYSASNLTGYTDNYTKTEDWIELYNTSSSSVDISGYYLSDNESFPMKWEIPAGTSIPAAGYLTFWASGRDEVSGENYHTNFKLKQTKETPEHVIFSNPSGTVINQFQLQITQVEHSVGRESDGSSTWKIFTFPTKGESNSNTSYTEYADAPIMSEVAGFYNGSVTISITTSDPNSTIYYTTNGNRPTSSSTYYDDPVIINSTTILKAVCISSDIEILPSFITFNTYFIDTDHTLPILSTAGNEMQTMLNGNQYLKPHGTIEYFKDGERKDFGYGEYNKHGQDSWYFDQRSYDYIARDEMGYHEAIKQKLLTLSDREEFQRIIIRASGDDNYPGIDTSAHMRDIFIQKLANKNKLNLDMRRGERCVSYVNGDFWGVYSIREKVTDSDYTKYYYDQDKYHLYYMMLWGGTWAEYGGDEAINDWTLLKNFILNNDMSDQSNFDYVASKYWYESLVDYVLVNSFVVCTDWINWNVGWWRGTDPEGDHQKWGYILWDEDATFNHYINYTNVPDETANASPCYPEGIWNDPGQHIEILNKLLDSDVFKQYYISRYQDLMNTVFIAGDMIDLLETIEDQIAPEMPKQINRWGGNFTEWQNNVQKVKDFITLRETVIPAGLNDCYDLTGPYNVTLSVEPVGAGGIKFNSVELTNDDFPWIGSYHGGMEMLMKATENNPNYIFDHWESENHTILPDINQTDVTLSLTQNDNIKAVFIPTTTDNNIVINEINYNSADNFDTDDWIELYNNGTETANLSNWIFKDENDTHEFVIPAGTTMSTGSYLVLAQSITDFQVQFPDVSNVIGNFDYGLSNNGELIRLFDNETALIDQVEYNDNYPWPVEPDGDGPTLELTNPDYDNNTASSWHASYAPHACHGTPGALNSTSTSIKELNNISINVYPNPMKYEAIIRLPDNINITDGKLFVYNILGEQVISKVFYSNEVVLKKKHLGSGLYICKLYNNDVYLGSQKLIVE
ncbi:MAG: lamin tail domain-containing protein [Bacteroidales bacterium]|nr:lamin tail domain-containing protein [Bacteroidales bacterium]